MMQTKTLGWLDKCELDVIRGVVWHEYVTHDFREPCRREVMHNIQKGSLPEGYPNTTRKSIDAVMAYRYS